MRYIVVVLLFSFITLLALASDTHLDANGAFGKYHLVNEFGSLYECNYTATVSSSPVRDIDLNVSTTVYSNNEQVNVTWISTFIPCIDDFIGIYSAEVPLSSGKDMLQIFRI